MYLSFFGLNDKPFAITPDPRYLYLSERHAEALAHLLYGINEAGGFVQLTGEVGTGKTTTIRSLLAQTPKNVEVALILNPRMSAPEFLLTICEEIGIGVPDSATGSLKDLVDILNDYLLKAHAGGRRVVLVVDEAQNLSTEVLEQVRLLTNLETNTQKLLQIILIGQPELRELLGRNELRQLAQRITGRYHLDPLSSDETSAYVRHRLRVAGATTDMFSAHALSEVFRLSGGVPRVINVISDRALLGAYTQDKHRVDGSLVRAAAAEVFGRQFAAPWLPWAGAAAAGVALVVTAVLLWEFAPWSSSSLEAKASTPTMASATPRAASAKELPTTGSPEAGADAAAPIKVASITPPASESLVQLLAAHRAETVPDEAFGKLFGIWGMRYTAGTDDPCTQAVAQGLECLVQRGSFGQLRQFNRPAILLLNDGSGNEHQVLLTNLSDERAKVDLGGARHDVGIGELSRYWFGDFVMLWRPATQNVKPLSVGMRGAEVRWLRQSLQRLSGSPTDAAASDLFDAELSRQVMEFQRRNQLAVDGIAGVQTQIVLASAVSGNDSPLLRSDPAHGG
jgi:general secretion pathway protein A